MGIMTNYFTIKLPEEDGERHNKRRKELGLTWAEYIDGEAPDYPNDGSANEEMLSSIKSAVETVEERTGSIQRQLDELQGL